MFSRRPLRPRPVQGTLVACPIVNFEDIPVFINNRDRLSTLQGLVQWLQASGTRVITILDNESTYGPLLAYYKALPKGVLVSLLSKNMGPWAFWSLGLHRQQNLPYVVTDSDLLPAPECPSDLIHRLNLLLSTRPESGKAGPGLKIDDLPDFHGLQSLNGCIKEEQLGYWARRYNSEAFLAPIDTTFALYSVRKDGDAAHGYLAMDNLRMDRPYLFRHMPWYTVPPLSEEESYYREHCIKGWSHTFPTQE